MAEPKTRPCLLANDPGTRPGLRSNNPGLLELNLGAGLLELGLDLVGLVLVDAFLDGLRSAFDQVLGFLEAKTGDGADFLDDLDLLVAGGSQNDRDLGLFSRRSSGSPATSRTSHCHGRSRRDAPLLFEELGEFG